MSGIDSDLIRGHIDTIILKALFEGDKYGYEICREVEDRSSGLYELKQPTLYSCLKRLEAQKLISSYWTDSEIGGKRHYYNLTELGKETFQNNQDEWNRSRVIIDSLISNGEKPTFVLSTEDNKELQRLKDEVESLKSQLETAEAEKDAAKEQAASLEEKLEEVKEESVEQVQEPSSPIVFGGEDKQDSDVKFVQLSDNFVARVAANGEILSVEKAEEAKKVEETQELSPAQASMYESSENLVFEEDGPDIMTLLGHGQSDEEDLKEQDKEETIIEKKPLKDENDEPFVFDENEFSEDKSESFLSSLDKASEFVYVAPSEEIVGLSEKPLESLSLREEETEKAPEKEQEEIVSVDISAPVYHDFGASRENYETVELKSEDDSADKADEDEIYQNPDKKEEPTLSFFDEDILETTEEEDSAPAVVFEPVEVQNSESGLNSEETTPLETVLPRENSQPDFYKTTENYEDLKTGYTEGKYKEKLSSLLSYQNRASATHEDFQMLVSPKEFEELREDFESEGIIVKPYVKKVKESKSAKSYIETNKLNIVNSWTAFGIVAFLTLLTFIIMNNYKAAFSTFDFSAKYFLIGLGVLLIVPAVYSVIFFINPYKKKPARYAARLHLLFALLLTAQLLIITYCINLQLGFYSFSQENYNHLLWIVPSLLSLYPVVDAILHNVYFKSDNFRA